MLRNKNVFYAVTSMLVLGCGSGAGPSSDGLSSGDSRVIWENSRVQIQGLPGSQIVPSQLSLTLESTILPPTVSGTTLQADDIYVNGLYTYVSYNLAGNTKMGGIDQMNMTLPFYPVRSASTTFTDTAVNGVYVNGSTVYMSGATSNGSYGPAVLDQLSLSGGSFSAIQQTFTPTSYAGTGVTMWNNSIYTLSGDTGGVTIVNPTTYAQTGSMSISDARGLAYYGTTSNLWVVAGQPGRLLSYDTNSNLVSTVNLGGASIPESKSTVQVGQTMVMASMGDGGAAVVCQADGHILAQIAAPVVNGVASTLTVTNAVAAGPGLLFAADGQAGVYVYLMTVGLPGTGNACNSVQLSLLGSIALGSNYSANNVKYANGNLYVATGLGGFKVINVSLSTAIVGALLDF